MLEVIFPMTMLTLVYIALNVLMWKWLKDKKLTIGMKIAITSKKPQTTRNRIQTVYTDERGQIVFLDTPGIHKAKNKLGEYGEGATGWTSEEAKGFIKVTSTPLRAYYLNHKDEGDQLEKEL